jgi:hypothetical protein
VGTLLSKIVKIFYYQCRGSGSTYNLPPAFGAGFGIRIRIQLFNHWRQKPKFTMISEVFRDNYMKTVKVSSSKTMLKYPLGAKDVFVI